MKILLIILSICFALSTLSCKSNTTHTNESSPIAVSSNTTPKELFKANYDAVKKKDVESFKRTFSSDWIKSSEEMAKSDGKTLNNFLLTDMMWERETALLPETAQAEITGDKGLIKVQDEKGSSRAYKIVKENGVWKLNSY
jgi:hypothetical protein